MGILELQSNHLLIIFTKQKLTIFFADILKSKETPNCGISYVRLYPTKKKLNAIYILKNWIIVKNEIFFGSNHVVSGFFFKSEKDFIVIHFSNTAPPCINNY